jgi:hypothetical protein
VAQSSFAASRFKTFETIIGDQPLPCGVRTPLASSESPTARSVLAPALSLANHPMAALLGEAKPTETVKHFLPLESF